MHNAIYESLDAVVESVAQLVKEEGLEIRNEGMPDIGSLKKNFAENDDFLARLSNGTWFHIQPEKML